MALQVKDDWFNFFCNAGTAVDTGHTYATAFVNIALLKPHYHN